MRRRGVIGCLSLLALIVLLVACGQRTNVPTWQEQYDLGVRYLSEGDYEEAIIAFTAAIEIDSKQPDAYLKAAEAYLALDDIDSAVAILLQGYEATGDDVSPSDSIKKELFDLFDEYTPYISLEQYLFTEDIVGPQEWTINGTPLWKASVNDIEAILGNDVIKVNGGPYYTGNYDDYYSYGGFITLNEDDFLVDKDSLRVLSANYISLGTECREITPGMTATECLTRLGVSDFGIDYFLERVFESQLVDSERYSCDYTLNWTVAHEEDVWAFSPTKWYVVDGAQWFLYYDFTDEDTGEEAFFYVIFLCDTNGIVREIRYRNQVNGVMLG